MTKTEKKLESQIIFSLTEACEQAKQLIPGFLWLTHKVDYKKINNSLTIYCVFNSSQHIEEMKKSKLQIVFSQLICQQLQKNKIQLKSPEQQICYVIESNFSLH